MLWETGTERGCQNIGGCSDISVQCLASSFHLAMQYWSSDRARLHSQVKISWNKQISRWHVVYFENKEENVSPFIICFPIDSTMISLCPLRTPKMFLTLISVHFSWQFYFHPGNKQDRFCHSAYQDSTPIFSSLELE